MCQHAKKNLIEDMFRQCAGNDGHETYTRRSRTKARVVALTPSGYFTDQNRVHGKVSRALPSQSLAAAVSPKYLGFSHSP
ncbi:hypothetical protein SCP_0507260 [Sparassis crispa]|uniref:Uncharacterized protein n=1 Tax=Sparassis crispa TaxID=139825 RepID=A0A401GN53_9APHY|nr:hypothetical protein SCP_0507260 [Sparassis crispa]GBE83671.1 hypothetical protein SCP_0507260 [Sparassis crispa]